MRTIIDLLVIIGGLMTAAGLFVEFGAGYSLIYFGAHLTCFGVAAAITHQRETADVPDKIE